MKVPELDAPQLDSESSYPNFMLWASVSLPSRPSNLEIFFFSSFCSFLPVLDLDANADVVIVVVGRVSAGM